MKKVICAVILLFVFLLPFPQSAFAAEMDELLQEELQRLEVEAVDRAAEGLEPEQGFGKLLRDILTGAFDFSFEDLGEELAEAAFGEFRIQGRLLAQLVLVVVLSAVLKQLNSSFQGKSVGEMGFYLCYMVLVVVILSSFHSISQSVVERISGICKVYEAMLPIFLVLSATSGNFTQTAMIIRYDGACADGRLGGTFLCGQLYTRSCDTAGGFSGACGSYFGKSHIGTFREASSAMYCMGHEGYSNAVHASDILAENWRRGYEWAGSQNGKDCGQFCSGGGECHGRRGGNSGSCGRHTAQRHAGCGGCVPAPALYSLGGQNACDTACVSGDGGSGRVYL